MELPHFTRSALATAAALVALSSPVASQAQSGGARVFEFFGTCSDCVLNTAPPASIAALILTLDYVLGNPLTVGDIIAFSYAGSNLVNPYTVTGGAFSEDPTFMPDIYAAAGSMTGDSGARDFRIEFIDGLVFESMANGAWYTCAQGPGGFYSGTCNLTQNQDIGSGSWNAAAVPEPSTYGLMALGLLGLAFTRRRKD